jgi:hypothetical protein
MRHPVILPGAPKPTPVTPKPHIEEPVRKIEIEIVVKPQAEPVIETVIEPVVETVVEVEAAPEKPKRARAPRKPTTRKPKAAAKEEMPAVETTAESAPSEE